MESQNEIFFVILVTSEFGCSSDMCWRGFGIIQHYLYIGKKISNIRLKMLRYRITLTTYPFKGALPS